MRRLETTVPKRTKTCSPRAEEFFVEVTVLEHKSFLWFSDQSVSLLPPLRPTTAPRVVTVRVPTEPTDHSSVRRYSGTTRL